MKISLDFRLEFQKISLVLLFLTSVTMLSAQKKNLFSLGAFGGLNLSQMDGDRHQGYDKFGFTAGVTGLVNVTERYKFGIDLGYSELGSKVGKINGSELNQGLHTFDISLNYAEIALTNSLLFMKIEEGRKRNHFYRLKGSIGISFNRLLGSEVTEKIPVAAFGGSRTPIIFTETEEFFNSNNVAFIIGGTLFLKKHIGLQLRYGIGMNRLYDSTDRRFVLYWLSFRGTYFF